MHLDGSYTQERHWNKNTNLSFELIDWHLIIVGALSTPCSIEYNFGFTIDLINRVACILMRLRNVWVNGITATLKNNIIIDTNFLCIQIEFLIKDTQIRTENWINGDSNFFEVLLRFYTGLNYAIKWNRS